MKTATMNRRGGLRAVLLLALLTGHSSALGQAEPEASPITSTSELMGIWAGVKNFGPRVQGPLTIEGHGASWVAEIAGFRVPMTFREGILSFQLPGDGGSFRGRLESSTGALHGQWIQPDLVSGFGQRFSTPLTLRSVAPGRFRGILHPLGDSIHVYLVLEEDNDGALHAYLRNPESNFGRILNITEIRRLDEAVELWGSLAWESEAEPRSILRGIYHSDGDILSIFIDGVGGTYDLRRLQDGAVSPFFPRSWAHGAYRYRPPSPLEDGWQTATLGSAGMAEGPMEDLVRKILTTPMDAIDAPHINAVLIARHGKLVFEEYFHGFSRDRPHDVRSASKSLTATLAGAAIHRGRITLDAKVYAAFPGAQPPGDLDPRAARMTLEHLLTMTSGLACDDWDGDSPGGEDRVQGQRDEPDWHRFLLRLPMVHEPGTHPAYCSVGMSLAGAMVARSTGLSIPEAFDRYLARPLAMSTYHTNLMPNGQAYGGGGLRLTARDFLKFGQLMLDDGAWHGRRILPQGWAQQATQKRYTLGHRRPEGYGYGWWLMEYQQGGRTLEAFYAGGNGGNYIIGIPELDLVVVFFASNYSQSVQHETKYQDVPDFILRSVLLGAREE